MKYFLRNGTLALVVALTLAVAQGPRRGRRENPGDDVKLPSGKSQREEILKADHEHDLQDAAALVGLAQELQKELEKNDRHILSVSSIRKTEDIEKLAKRIRGRLRRY